jgi:pimeloyl-ACP methyl ester carboxylesterase
MKRIVGGVVLLMVALTAAFGIGASWSRSGWFLLGVLALAGAAFMIRERIARRTLSVVAAVLFGALLLVRIIGAEGGLVRMMTFPQESASRWLGRLVDEQDLALVGTRLLSLRYPLSGDERTGLLAAMHDAYADMAHDDPVTPSPVLDTLLGRQDANASDTLVVEPRLDARPAPKVGVLFLHGYAGSHTLECWMIAKAAQAVGAVTVCPATGFAGHWHGQGATRIVGNGLDYLRRRGITKVFLAGLSNGAVGGVAMAPIFAKSLAGVILVSGAPADGNAAGLPAIVLHGRDDRIASPASAQAFAKHTGAQYVELASGHFALLMRREEARKAIADWLMARLGLHESGTVRR